MPDRKGSSTAKAPAVKPLGEVIEETGHEVYPFTPHPAEKCPALRPSGLPSPLPLPGITLLPHLKDSFGRSRKNATPLTNPAEHAVVSRHSLRVWAGLAGPSGETQLLTPEGQGTQQKGLVQTRQAGEHEIAGRGIRTSLAGNKQGWAFAHEGGHLGKQLPRSCPVEIKRGDRTHRKAHPTTTAVIQDVDSPLEIDALVWTALDTEVAVRKSRVPSEATGALYRRLSTAYPVEEAFEAIQGLHPFWINRCCPTSS